MADYYDTCVSKFKKYGCAQKILLTTVFSPLECAKALIQMGHEPLPAIPAKTIFGRPVLVLPNVFKYVNHIYNVEGVSGCFRGLTPRICSALLSTVVIGEVQAALVDRELSFNTINTAVEVSLQEPPSKEKALIKVLKRDIITHSIAIIVTQPFNVVTFRIMGQFVGQEYKYNGVLDSLYTLYKDEGIPGLFSGIVPRFIGEISTIVFTHTILYGIRKYLIPVDDGLQDHAASVGVDFLVKNLTYPFTVVSVCMAVNNSGLRAGSPPYMPDYDGSWTECWNHLSQMNQLKRGAGLFWRYHTIPKSGGLHLL